jgi:IS1 family transposase
MIFMGFSKITGQLYWHWNTWQSRRKEIEDYCNRNSFQPSLLVKWVNDRIWHAHTYLLFLPISNRKLQCVLSSQFSQSTSRTSCIKSQNEWTKRENGQGVQRSSSMYWDTWASAQRRTPPKVMRSLSMLHCLWASSILHGKVISLLC